MTLIASHVERSRGETELRNTGNHQSVPLCPGRSFGVWKPGADKKMVWEWRRSRTSTPPREQGEKCMRISSDHRPGVRSTGRLFKMFSPVNRKARSRRREESNQVLYGTTRVVNRGHPGSDEPFLSRPVQKTTTALARVKCEPGCVAASQHRMPWPAWCINPDRCPGMRIGRHVRLSEGLPRCPFVPVTTQLAIDQR
jgi:hypothetical protein